MASTHCPSCGGKISHPQPAVCNYCGAALELVSPAVSPSAALATRERFEALARYPRLPDLLRREPGAGAQYFQGGAAAAVGIIFAVIALFMFLTARSITFHDGTGRTFGTFFGLICLFFLAVGLLVVASSMKKTAAFAAAPLERLQALVADKRTEISGGGNGSATTRYFVTLETADGRRREVGTPGRIAGKAIAGDVGVAYVKGGSLLDFERVQV